MSYSATVLADSPTAYYRLDETSGTNAADSSGNGNTGTYQGTFTLNAAGLLTGDSDAAVAFATGAGNVLLPSTLMTMASATTPFTLEAWFKTTMAGNGGILCGRQTASGTPLMTLSIQSGHLHIEFRDSGGAGFVQTTISDTLFNDGVRHHVVLTRDSSKAWRLYVDGCIVARGVDTMTGSITAMTRTHIGWEQTNNWRFTGTIDEVAFYQGAALSAAQIAAHYTAGSGEPTTATTTDAYATAVLTDGATAYYRLDEISSCIRAVDATGNGNHGARRKGAVGGISSLLPTTTDGATSTDGTLDGRIDLPVNDLIDTATDNLTIEVWVKETAANAAIICGRSPVSGNPVMDLCVGFEGNSFTGSGTATAFTRDNTGTGVTGTLRVEINSGVTVNDGKAHQIVLTRTGSDKKWRLYVDGSLAATSSADTISAITGLDFMSIGLERTNTLISRLTATVDEIAIYKGVALNAGQVLNHWNEANQSTVPFIGSVTAVHAPSLPNVPMPFISSHTTAHAPALQDYAAVPFISTATAVHAPTLSGTTPEIDVPFIASRTRIFGVFSLFDPDKTFSGPGNGGEGFLIRLAANGATQTAALAANITDSGTLLELTGDSSLPSTEPFVVTIDDEVLYVVQLAAGSYRIRGRGVSNTTPAAHTAGATVAWGDSYDMAIIATRFIGHDFTGDVNSTGTVTYPGWLMAYDSSQAYLGGDRYPMHITELAGVFDAGAGTTGTNRTDGAQPNAICVPAGVSDDCPAALSNPALLTSDVVEGDVAVVRYTNPEASVLDLGPRSASIQSWYGLMRVDTTNGDVTFTDPDGIVVDTTGTYDTFTGSIDGEWGEPVPLITGIAPDTGEPTPNTVPYTTVTLPGTDRFFTRGSGSGGYNRTGWPICCLAVRQGKKRVPFWQSWDWHNFSFVYDGFGADDTYAQVLINRNGIDFGSPVPDVDFPGPQDTDGPDAVWDDATYFVGAAWYVAIYNTPYLLGGPSIGGVSIQDIFPTGDTPIPELHWSTGGGTPTVTYPSPPYVEGGSGGGINPSTPSLFQAASV